MAYSTVYICSTPGWHKQYVGFVCSSNTQVHLVHAGNEGPSGASISVYGGSGSHLFSQYSPALFEFLVSARLQIAEKHKTWESENMWCCDPRACWEMLQICRRIYSIPRTSTGSVVFNLERDGERRGELLTVQKRLGISFVGIDFTMQTMLAEIKCRKPAESAYLIQLSYCFFA